MSKRNRHQNSGGGGGGGHQSSQSNGDDAYVTYKITPLYEPFAVFRLPRLYLHLLLKHPWQTVLGTAGIWWAMTFAFFFVVNGLSRNPALITQGFEPGNPKHLATNVSAFMVPTVANTAGNLQQVVYSDATAQNTQPARLVPADGSMTFISAVSGQPTRQQPKIQVTRLKY